MLTVVLPNFNHARFLPFSLGALLAQTRPADEVIIIDDVSTDDSIAVIESFLPRLPNHKLLRNEINIGTAGNMNIGLELAHGSEIVFVAADDVIYPTFFERLLALLQSYPQAAFASARTDLIDVAGSSLGPLRCPAPLVRPGYIDPRTAAAFLMRDEAWFTGNATIFRRQPLIELGGFPEELASFTDGFTSRLLAVKYGVCYTPEILAAWRQLQTGMALSYMSDISQVRQVTKLAADRMRENGRYFVPGYPERWKRRALFSARLLALSNARRRAKSKGWWRYMLALAREVVLGACLFARLRPQDTFTVLRRRLDGWRE
jgi:glycosyltransferase involved in cell wall biosynthesis